MATAEDKPCKEYIDVNLEGDKTIKNVIVTSIEHLVCKETIEEWLTSMEEDFQIFHHRKEEPIYLFKNKEEETWWKMQQEEGGEEGEQGERTWKIGRVEEDERKKWQLPEIQEKELEEDANNFQAKEKNYKNGKKRFQISKIEILSSLEMRVQTLEGVYATLRK